MNKWEKELVHTASQNIYSNLACDISEKFDEIVDIFNGLSTEQYFKAQTEMLEKDFHRELLEVEKIYRKNLEKPASDWTSATYPYLAKFIYSYRHLAWQIYCVSTDLYQC